MTTEASPDDRSGTTRCFRIPYVVDNPDGTKTVAHLKFYATANVYPDGRLREVFLRADKAGSFASGVLDAFAIMLSLGLQHGVPLELVLTKLRHLRFDPDGRTGDGEFPTVASAIDYLAQWLAARFLRAPLPPAVIPT